MKAFVCPVQVPIVGGSGRAFAVHRPVSLLRPPIEPCPYCWARYGQLLHKHHSRTLAQSRGRAKGGGQSAKAKGRKLVQWIAETLVEAFRLHPDDVLVKATSMGGADLHMSPLARSKFPFRIEAKAVEALSIWAALKQAETEAQAKPGRDGQPVVFFTRAHAPVYVALSATAFIRALGGILGEKSSTSTASAGTDQ